MPPTKIPCLAALTIVLVIVFSKMAYAQMNAGVADAKRPQPRAEYESHVACVNCHRELPAYAEEFIQLIQRETWEKKDKHSQAFNLLISDTSHQLVTRLLGFDLREFVKNGELNHTALQPSQRARLKSCLHCHSAWPHDREQPPIASHLGVSCQACHGPGRSWSEAHRSEDKVWRLVSAAEKARLHMTDVHNPIVRTQLCASCHIGDVKQHRFVTHDMYVLGHPPLPSIEPESFAEQMPEHWQTLPQKLRKKVFDMWDSSPEGLDRIAWSQKDPRLGIAPEDIKSSYREANYPDHDPSNDLPHTRNVIVGGLVLLQSSLELLADLSQLQQSGGHVWPEFAMYDCSACHHELRTGPIATGRPFRPVPPGRPPMPLWPTALVRAAFVQQAGNLEMGNKRFAEFERHLLNVENAVTRPLFGNTQQIQTTARELAEKINILALQLTNSRYDRQAAKLALLVLTDPNQSVPRDYHSARQMAWAIRRIAKELAEVDAELTIEKLFVGPAGEDILGLELPQGQDKSVIDNLPRFLKAAANYDPDWFASELTRLHAAVIVSK